MLQSAGQANDDPVKVMPVPWLFRSLDMLEALMCEDSPVVAPVRHERVAQLIYGFADASGRGLGVSTQVDGSDQIQVRLGVWACSEETETSSNWKELANVQRYLEDKEKRENLRNSIIFMFTDNSAVESAISKGNSASRRLFELVCEIRSSQFRHGF